MTSGSFIIVEYSLRNLTSYKTDNFLFDSITDANSDTYGFLTSNRLVISVVNPTIFYCHACVSCSKLVRRCTATQEIGIPLRGNIQYNIG